MITVIWSPSESAFPVPVWDRDKKQPWLTNSELITVIHGPPLTKTSNRYWFEFIGLDIR